MSFIARFLADQRGMVFVHYSSLVLLLAIAAIAVLSQSDGHFPN